jgi:hypothetical protein
MTSMTQNTATAAGVIATVQSTPGCRALDTATSYEFALVSAAAAVELADDRMSGIASIGSRCTRRACSSRPTVATAGRSCLVDHVHKDQRQFLPLREISQHIEL